MFNGTIGTKKEGRKLFFFLSEILKEQEEGIKDQMGLPFPPFLQCPSTDPAVPWKAS